jgi:PmbA protein
VVELRRRARREIDGRDYKQNRSRNFLTRYSGGSPGDNLDFSGIAKNAFYIEGGQVRYPLAETMISGNLRDLLLAIRDISKDTVNFGSAEYPTIAAGGVTIHAH